MPDSTSPMYHKLLHRVSASITPISLIGNVVLSKSQYPMCVITTESSMAVDFRVRGAELEWHFLLLRNL